MTVNVLNGTSVLEMGCTVAGLGSSIALISLDKFSDKHDANVSSNDLFSDGD